MNYARFSFLLGFLAWFLATLLFRFLGQIFFRPEDGIFLLGIYVIIVPVLGILAILVFKKFRLSKLESVYASVLMVLPGVLIDSFVVQNFSSIFPNMPGSYAAPFGAWLLWAYGFLLLIGVLQKEK